MVDVGLCSEVDEGAPQPMQVEEGESRHLQVEQGASQQLQVEVLGAPKWVVVPGRQPWLAAAVGCCQVEG